MNTSGGQNQEAAQLEQKARADAARRLRAFRFVDREKGDGSLFLIEPDGCFAKKTPVPFFPRLLDLDRGADQGAFVSRYGHLEDVPP